MRKLLLEWTSLTCVMTALSLTAVAADDVDIKSTEDMVTHNDVSRWKAGDGADTTITLKATADNTIYSTYLLKCDVAVNSPTTAGKVNVAQTLRIPKAQYDRIISVTAEVNRASAETGPSPELVPFDIYLDSKAPSPSFKKYDRYPGGSGTISIKFEDDDLDPESVSVSDFRLFRESTNGSKSLIFPEVPVDSVRPFQIGDTEVTIEVSNLSPGIYHLVVNGLGDLVKNTIPVFSGSFDPASTGIVKLEFEVPEGNERGLQVEYPRNLRPENEPSEFDPGDRVDTRVVQLYYFRDARLVAEYINRNIKDLHQSSYDDAQRFAENARNTANEKIDDRRTKENVAVDNARRSREIEHQINETKSQLEEAYARQDSLNVEQEQIKSAALQFGVTPENVAGEIVKSVTSLETIQSDVKASAKKVKAAEKTLTLAEQQESALVGTNASAAEKKAAADKRIAAEEALAIAQSELESNQDAEFQAKNKLAVQRTIQSRNKLNAKDLERVGGVITSLSKKLEAGQLPKQLQDEQTKEIVARNEVLQAESSELRAAQEQFRREVIAGLADRNSYAAGKLTSIDPVTQVTISVVGTSRLQLRGPIKGVNKICRMVHQLDSPVGQVKLGIHTIQVNGEHGDRMDYVYERINKEVAHSRFLVNTSGQLLRRAVQEVAAEVAQAADDGYLPEGCPPELSASIVNIDGEVQTDARQRERRYLYAFFGSDFISELEEMDSELLNSENKMVSIHSMDTISLAGTLFVMAHADHPVRQRMIMRFQELISGELPEREREYIQALTHVTKHGKSLQNRFRTAMKVDAENAAEIYFNAQRTYHFPNTVSYFNEQIQGQGTLNPVQYATIKMAQALKAQLVAEMELKNHVLERSLLEKREGDTEKSYQQKTREASERSADAERAAATVISDVAPLLIASSDSYDIEIDKAKTDEVKYWIDKGFPPTDRQKQDWDEEAEQAAGAIERMKTLLGTPTVSEAIYNKAIELSEGDEATFIDGVWEAGIVSLGLVESDKKTTVMKRYLGNRLAAANNPGSELGRKFHVLYLGIQNLRKAKMEESKAIQEAAEYEERLFSKRLMDQFIDEQEEKSVELMEALRSHSSNVDNYLKRLAIAVEDDVSAQFYEPAFQRIRRVSRTWDVTLGQIETTTVLTNNRTLAKVSPSATYEFDLPQRDILLTEALNGSKALATEYGNLLKDGTFLAGTAMLSGQPPTGILGDNAAIQGLPGINQNQSFGSELQKLIPDPAIYKFETGTGFEIQPVIQPDGHSIVYGFNYMYSTNVREPVRADEKHLGRIKRHFVHTDVQTSSYELREISRYTVALKASRTDRGVPLLEDLPGVGAAFRPLPSDESSLQTNIILGSSTIYPTVFDLMGLRWSAYVDQLSSPGIAEEKETQVDRREELKSHLLGKTRARVNERIGLQGEKYPKVNRISPGFIPPRN